MSLVIDLIGQLNCQVIGWVDSLKLIGACRSVYCSGWSFVSQIVSLLWFRCLVVCMAHVTVGFGSVAELTLWHVELCTVRYACL